MDADDVVIALGGRSPEGLLWRSHDVAVFFSPAVARRYGALVPGDPD